MQNQVQCYQGLTYCTECERNFIWSPCWYYPGICLRESIKITIFLIRIIDLPDEGYIRFLSRIKLNAKLSTLRRSGIILSVCNAKSLIL